MKAFKINSKPAIALIAAALSLSVKNKASRKERQEIIKGLQYVMAKNRAKYGVDVLEINKFLFTGLMEIKAIEDTDDVLFIEEVEVEGAKIEPKKSTLSGFEAFLNMLAGMRDVKVNSDQPKSSPTEETKDDCDCPFCKTRRDVVAAVAKVKEFHKE